MSQLIRNNTKKKGERIAAAALVAGAHLHRRYANERPVEHLISQQHGTSKEKLALQSQRFE